MRIVDPIISELEREAETTKRVLERVPNDKLNWKPHAKSMSLGQLAQHVATTPGGVASMIVNTEREAAELGKQPSAESAAQLVPTLMIADQVKVVRQALIEQNQDAATFRIAKRAPVIFLRDQFPMPRQ